MDKTPLSRRKFLASSSATAALASTSATSLASPSTSANSRLKIGFIGVGGRCRGHVDSAIHLQVGSGLVECAAVCDVFNRNKDATAKHIEDKVGVGPIKTGDYREILADSSIDAVVIATPDHWHARQTIDALRAGKHVYCEKPMTHTVQEALDVYKAWKDSGKVMQVGVQSTSLPVWSRVNEDIRAGKLGKIMQYQTEFFRNSNVGQWRYYGLDRDMNPRDIDWDTFVGHEYGLAPKQPFDRARYAQWRCYWDFGSGMYTDLFVHRTTSMLKATGLRFPGRVVGAGGIFLEYDGRDVPDVATVVADFPAGVQGLVTATMSSSNVPIRQAIRGHSGSAVFGTGEEFTGYDFVAERPQVTLDSSIKDERIEVGSPLNSSLTHFTNFVEAAMAEAPEAVNCSPELGAAAMVIVKLGTKSYREGKVFRFDEQSMAVSEGDGSWAKGWEQMSHARADANHVPGWNADEKGSKLVPPSYQELAGPWINGLDPSMGPNSR